MKLTKDQILKGIVSPFLTLLAFALSFLEDKTLAKEILDETANSVAELEAKLETPPTVDEAVEAGFELAETITSTTETHVDDAVLGTVKGFYEAAKGHGGGLIAAIKGWIQIHKAKKADASAEATDATTAAPAE